MSKINISYKGNLRTEMTHLSSGSKIITDAPIDNNGEGKYFSPTDLVASAYGSCMLTIIGIYCNNHNLNFKNADVSIEKIMFSNPRRIGEINLVLDLQGNNWDDKEKKKIEAAARACPVAKSVDPEIKLNITFKY